MAKRRVYDGMDIIQERDSTNLVTAAVVRAGNIGGILSRGTAAGTTYFGYDLQGNVTTLTDESGNVVGSYTYDAFGNTIASSGNARASENPYRFSTKEAIGGLYSFGFRFYNPSRGRWINRDPIGESGGVNLYGFVGNDPINGWDEYGLSRWQDFWVGVSDYLDGRGRSLVGETAQQGVQAIDAYAMRGGRIGSRVASSVSVRTFSKAVPMSAALVARGDKLGVFLPRVKPLQGYFDVAVHGTADSFHILHNGEWAKINHRSLLTFLRKSGYKGGPIRLLSCSTGAATNGVAQNLSNKIGAAVIAPSQKLWIHPNGALTMGRSQFSRTGEWMNFTPSKP